MDIEGVGGVVTAGLNPRDVFFNALPMFHSFGLGMATVMTTLHGIKTVYYPSPLHYKIIPELIYDTNATVLKFGWVKTAEANNVVVGVVATNGTAPYQYLPGK